MDRDLVSLTGFILYSEKGKVKHPNEPCTSLPFGGYPSGGKFSLRLLKKNGVPVLLTPRHK